MEASQLTQPLLPHVRFGSGAWRSTQLSGWGPAWVPSVCVCGGECETSCSLEGALCCLSPSPRLSMLSPHCFGLMCHSPAFHVHGSHRSGPGSEPSASWLPLHGPNRWLVRWGRGTGPAPSMAGWGWLPCGVGTGPSSEPGTGGPCAPAWVRWQLGLCSPHAECSCLCWFLGGAQLGTAVLGTQRRPVGGNVAAGFPLGRGWVPSWWNWSGVFLGAISTCQLPA